VTTASVKIIGLGDIIINSSAAAISSGVSQHQQANSKSCAPISAAACSSPQFRRKSVGILILKLAWRSLGHERMPPPPPPPAQRCTSYNTCSFFNASFFFVVFGLDARDRSSRRN